ncbi:purine-binding chemotaxis protein CheW [Vibrio sp. SM6]|uniref:Chemotaxis protein CheW n=1 Tax=Vibrio agarilyticus TaxID=2726741 RepID=A0A7X8YG26_9VIBR|nr:chemotaxis protein CheW [Vibrio agarilyticus]NLS11932.1 purine-binding chemotaxis protein CheW [Vibrio agarilyticus]
MHNDEYLSFMLDGDEYSVPILQVREVRGWTPVRAVPHGPRSLLGVLEIRGEYVPVVDLRQCFALEPASLCATTVVIVVNLANHQPLGIVVDAVAEVYSFSASQIKPPPQGLHIHENYIQGLAAIAGRHVIIIDLMTLCGAAITDKAHKEKISAAC